MAGNNFGYYRPNMPSAARVKPERFRERLEHAGFSQAALARRIGVAQATIAKLALGESAGSKHLHRIARELGTTPSYLTGETDDPHEGALPTPTPELIAEQLDLVLVPEIDLAYGMGGTFLDTPVSQRTVPFPREWLRTFTKADPVHLFFARGDGDSMMPTIMDSDIVLIDRSDATINRQDRIWAIAYGDIGMIKRVRAMPDGSYKIMSDNPNVETEIAVDGEMFVIGRVAGVIRKT